MNFLIPRWPSLLALVQIIGVVSLALFASLAIYAPNASAADSTSGECTGELFPGYPTSGSASARLVPRGLMVSMSEATYIFFGEDAGNPLQGNSTLVVRIESFDASPFSGSITFAGQTSSWTFGESVASFTVPNVSGAYEILATITLRSNRGFCNVDLTLSGSVQVLADVSAPKVRPKKVKAKLGSIAKFVYLISGETGPTSEVIDVRKTLKARPVKVWKIRAQVNSGPALVKSKLPKRIVAGRWLWCVTSTDSNGNTSRPTCATLLIN